jgi:toxin-antitoxin system PIN domain toxin
MNVLDANVVVALYRPDHPHHAVARRWWDESLSAGEPFTVPDLVWLAFFRLVTNSRLMPVPATFDQAWEYSQALQAQGSYAVYQAHPRTLVEYSRIASRTRVTGNLSTDAYIAAIATTLGAHVVTFDRDFRKFDGVRVVELPA